MWLSWFWGFGSLPSLVSIHCLVFAYTTSPWRPFSPSVICLFHLILTQGWQSKGEEKFERAVAAKWWHPCTGLVIIQRAKGRASLLHCCAVRKLLEFMQGISCLGMMHTRKIVMAQWVCLIWQRSYDIISTLQQQEECILLRENCIYIPQNSCSFIKYWISWGIHIW